MPDYLPVSQNMDDPLPPVDPNSDLVPYRLSRTEPGQEPVITTGYGPRARPPIQPPEGFGGGVGMPSLDRIFQGAFSQLPVDQAIKASEAATRFIGQRGYMRDIQSGKDAAQAFSKWGPMLFHQATGIPEALNVQLQQQKMLQPKIVAGGQNGLFRVGPAGAAEVLAAPRVAPPKLHIAANGEIIQENPDATFKVLRPKDAQAETGGPVQGQPVLDPNTKEPIPGLIATPSAGGKGMTVRLTPKAQADLTPTSASEYFKSAPDIDRLMGVNPKAAGSFTKRMATNMVDIASRVSDKKAAPNPAQPQAPNPYSVGRQYGKLVYKGGDPKLESSWEKAK